MKERTKRQLDHLLLGLLVVTGIYAGLFLGGSFFGALSEEPFVHSLTTTGRGMLALASVLFWCVVLGGWGLRRVRRSTRRTSEAAQDDEVLGNLRNVTRDDDER